jgi:hypothetical protein
MKKFVMSLVLALSALVLAAPASGAILIRFNPSSSHIAVGDTVNVEMTISGLDDEILSAFDINLLFNSLILNNFAVTHDAVPHFGGLGNSYFDTDFGAGNTGVIDGSLLLDDELLGQAHACTVLSFSFQGLIDGFSLLGLGPDLDFERNFVGLNFASLTVDVGSACVSVGTGVCATSVPEPSMLSLLGLGLAGFAFMRRRKH